MARVRLALGFVFALVACEDSSSSTQASPDGGGGPVEVPSTCTEPTGAGTTHATSPTSDETWTAADSPHLVTADQSIAAGRKITIEPCAVVKVAEGVGFLVEGALVATGAADKPIRIERSGAAAWRSIETRKGGDLRMAYATVDGGGATGGGRLAEYATIDVRGDQESAPQPIFFADHVTVKGSSSLGVRLREGGAFAPGSTQLVVSGGATYPVFTWGNAAGTLPTGVYTGNAVDEILIPANGGRDDIIANTTFANLGVPYRIGGDGGAASLTVGKSGVVPVLTIAAGVTLRFAKAARLLVAAEGDNAIGALRAEGTAAAPIVFTSAEASPKAGDWTGILFAGKPDSRDAISNAKIAYAGGASQVSSYGCASPAAGSFANEAAVVIYGGQPASAFVTSTTIESSAGDGVVRGWTGDPVDFAATNTFTSVARCKQTDPKPVAGSCPAACQ